MKGNTHAVHNERKVIIGKKKYKQSSSLFSFTFTIFLLSGPRMIQANKLNNNKHQPTLMMMTI